MEDPFHLFGVAPEECRDPHSIQKDISRGISLHDPSVGVKQVVAQLMTRVENHSIGACAQQYLKAMSAPPRAPTADKVAQPEAETMHMHINSSVQRRAEWENEQHLRKIWHQKHLTKMAEICAAGGPIFFPAGDPRRNQAAPTKEPVVADNAPKSQTRAEKNRASRKFIAILRGAKFRDALERGARIANKIEDENSENPAMLGIEYSASTVVCALKALKLFPEHLNRKNLAESVRAYFGEINWESRAEGDPNAAKQLVKWYEVGRAMLDEESDVAAAARRSAIRQV